MSFVSSCRLPVRAVQFQFCARISSSSSENQKITMDHTLVTASYSAPTSGKGAFEYTVAGQREILYRKTDLEDDVPKSTTVDNLGDLASVFFISSETYSHTPYSCERYCWVESDCGRFGGHGSQPDSGQESVPPINLEGKCQTCSISFGKGWHQTKKHCAKCHLAIHPSQGSSRRDKVCCRWEPGAGPTTSASFFHRCIRPII